jgi:hypothetical protein
LTVCRAAFDLCPVSNLKCLAAPIMKVIEPKVSHIVINGITGFVVYKKQ